jgi:hypothetical protein
MAKYDRHGSYVTGQAGNPTSGAAIGTDLNQLELSMGLLWWFQWRSSSNTYRGHPSRPEPDAVRSFVEAGCWMEATNHGLHGCSLRESMAYGYTLKNSPDMTVDDHECL